MRTETTTRTLYLIHELDDAAQSRALDAMRAANWSEDIITEDIPETILWSLGNTFDPGSDRTEPKGVDLDGWDLDRGQYVALSGRIYAEDAPGLPWVEGIESVGLTSGRYGTSIDVEVTFDEEGEEVPSSDDIGTMIGAVEDAISKAWGEASRQFEYLYGDEYLMESASINEVEFTERGDLA